MAAKAPQTESEIRTMYFGSVNELIDSFRVACPLDTYDSVLATYILIWFGIPYGDVRLLRKEDVVFHDEDAIITVNNKENAPRTVVIRNPQAVSELKQYAEARFYCDSIGRTLAYRGATFLRSTLGGNLGEHWLTLTQIKLNKYNPSYTEKIFNAVNVARSSQFARLYAQFKHFGIEVTPSRPSGVELVQIAPYIASKLMDARNWIARYWKPFYLWCQIYREN